MNYRYAMVMSVAPVRPWSELGRNETRGVVLAQPCWRPAADVYETPDAVLVTVDLAGVDSDQVDVVLYADALVIEGERHLGPTGLAGRYLAAEIRQGPFRLEVTLPADIDPEHADARYDRGLLALTLRKARSSSNGG
jgi:HSP20 family protein